MMSTEPIFASRVSADEQPFPSICSWCLQPDEGLVITMAGHVCLLCQEDLYEMETGE